jgi:hypothetical protein
MPIFFRTLRPDKSGRKKGYPFGITGVIEEYIKYFEGK